MGALMASVWLCASCYLENSPISPARAATGIAPVPAAPDEQRPAEHAAAALKLKRADALQRPRVGR